MKISVLFLSIACNTALFIIPPCIALEALPTDSMLIQKSVNSFIEKNEEFSQFDLQLIDLIDYFKKIKDQPVQEFPFLTMLNSMIAEQKTMAPSYLIKAALEEIFDYLITGEAQISEKEKEQLLVALEEYYNSLESDTFSGKIVDAPDNAQGKLITRNTRFKRYQTLRTNALLTNYLTAKNTMLNGTVFINNNESVTEQLTVSGTLRVASDSDFFDFIEVMGKPQQGCILFVDEGMNEKVRFCSNSSAANKGVFATIDGGITQNIHINNEGGTVIAPPAANSALSATSNDEASAITVTGNATTTAPALLLLDVPTSENTDSFLTIDGSGIVKQSSSGTNVVINGCQEGALTIGTNDTNSLIFATNGCTTRASIDPYGAVSITNPTAGQALTTNGNIIVPQTNLADDQGTFKLGDSATTRINVYQFGSGNFFAASGTANTTVSGTNNISIGTNANNTLTTANNTISIGTNTQVIGNDSNALGNAANTSGARSIIIGSTDSTNSGTAPTTSSSSTIVFGSASSTNQGASATGASSIAIGGADSITFAGAVASGSLSIAFGVNATANTNTSIALGSASGIAGGIAASVSNSGTAGIALGSAQETTRGASSSNISSIAIGSADGTSAGASASGTRSIALGLGANASAAGAIALGSASSTGSLGPTASGTTSIVIGSANSAQRGAASSTPASIAIGGSDNVSPGASATGSNSCISLGVGASTSQANALILGNSVTTAVKVGIGTSNPGAKLDIVGTDGTPVMRINQVTTGLGNAPRWINPSTSVDPGTPIHYNSSNQLFGFSSSARYKTNIRPLESESNIVYQLNPVIYDSKYDDGKNIAGFIAEEVYMIAPDLVILNNEGVPENIAYNSFHALVIKEIQKHQRQLTNNAALLAMQKKKLKKLITLTQKLQKKNTIINNKKLKKQ